MTTEIFENVEIERKIIHKKWVLCFKSALFDSMTVEENVKFPLIMLSDLSNSEKKKE